MSNLPIQTTQIPSGFCPSDYQSMWNMFAQHGFVSIVDSVSQLIVSATKPTDTTKAWLQLDSLGRPVRLYWFAQGAWLSLHPQVPGSTMIWTTALPDFTTFDGGDANALSALSGPMWEEVVALRAKFPVGVGTWPAPPAGTGASLAVGDTGGEQLHVLTAAEGVDLNHIHTVGRAGAPLGSGTHPDAQDGFYLTGTSLKTGSAHEIQGNNGGGGTSNVEDLTGDWFVTSGVNTPVGFTVAGHNTLPPYVAVYYLRRTQRTFYSIS